MKISLSHRFNALMKLAEELIISSDYEPDDLMSYARNFFIAESKYGPIDTLETKIKVAKRLTQEFDISKSDLQLIVEAGLILAQDSIRFRSENESC